MTFRLSPEATTFEPTRSSQLRVISGVERGWRGRQVVSPIVVRVLCSVTNVNIDHSYNSPHRCISLPHRCITLPYLSYLSHCDFSLTARSKVPVAC